jgi:hypothetical protein
MTEHNIIPPQHKSTQGHDKRTKSQDRIESNCSLDRQTMNIQWAAAVAVN